jgi:glycosyltransferase involved in cell wall biosynthesis
MPTLVLMLPGRLSTRTGGYGYDRQIVAGLRGSGWTVEVVELDGSFPRPTRSALDHAAQALAAIPDDTAVLIDGLALGAMPAEVERERSRLRLLAVVHHPLARESGIGADAAAALEASERRALAAVRRVVVTSPATRDALAAYGVDRERVAVIEPGTGRAPLARGSGSRMLHLLAVGSVVPRKGHEVLIRALAQCDRENWRLTCVGSLDRHPETAERLRSLIQENGLGGRVRLVGEVTESEMAGYYDGADVFVLPTLYEGYGMAVAEALACGLPVISTVTGAIGDLAAGAGILVPPSDPDALAAALLQMMTVPGLRDRLAAGARDARERLPRWDDASRRMAEVVSVELQR